jgi:hypothetical protein
VIVTKPVLSCVILYKAEIFAEALAVSIKATSSKISLLQLNAKISDVQKANKYLKFFIIINF